MNILHYSLGLPPYRTGGLTKYSFDLMKEQAQNGENVFLLFPGKMAFVNGKVKVKYYKNKLGITTYEMVNPLPVPLLNGISEPEKYIKSCDKEVFKEFLLKYNIQIVHIHTLMGLYKEFLEACNELNIKKVFTTHDYFGICTKVNFINNEGTLCNERNIERCLRCNKTGNSIKTIKVLQSPIYRFLKDKGIISKLKPQLQKLKRDKNNYKNNLIDEQVEISDKYRKDYIKLINYYEDMFKYIDNFLFNSTVAKEVYEKYIKCSGQVISITHGDIKDNRRIKKYDHKKLKLTYLGPYKEYKGFNILMDVMQEINKDYKSSLELNLYGDTRNLEIDSNIKFHGRYSYNQLESIFDNTDLLIIPSIWKETFGFIGLEALSYGAPVLCTNNVGVKDVINTELKKGFVVKENKKQIINKLIKFINNRELLKCINRDILKGTFQFNMCDHFEDIMLEYNKILEK